MLITLAVAAEVKNRLAAFGAIMRYGKHTKEITGCYSKYSENQAMMEGVVAGLRAVTRPSEIAVITASDSFPACLKSTPFQHLREGADELEQTHEIVWHYDPNFIDLPLCLALAEDSILKYQDACALASPALPDLRLAAKVFLLPENTPVFVRRWLSKSDDGEDVWGKDIEVAMDRIIH